MGEKCLLNKINEADIINYHYSIEEHHFGKCETIGARFKEISPFLFLYLCVA